jgi:molybdopterin synthase sulfur carrier subunit
MATVFIPPQLRDLTGGAARVIVAGATVGELVRALEAAHPGLGATLADEETIRPGLALSIDGVMNHRGLRSQVGPQSEVHILPALGGG